MQFFGSVATGYAIGKIIGKAKAYRTKKFLEKHPIEEFLPYEEQYRFPQEVIGQKSEIVDFETEAYFTRPYPGSFLETHKMPKGKWPSGKRQKIGFIKGYKRTGEGLVPELIPSDKGWWETWVKPRIHIKPEKGFLPGLRITDIGPTISKPFKGPTDILSLLGGARAITQVRPIPPRGKELDPFQWIDPIQRMERIQEPKPRIIQMAGRTPKQRPWVHPFTTPMPTIEETTRQRRRQKQRQRTITTPIMPTITIQEPKEEPTIPFIPIPRLFLEPRKRKRAMRLPFEEKKKRRRKDSLLFGFEQRRYAVQTAKELKRLLG